MKKHTTLFILITLVSCLMLNGCAGKGIANKSDKRVLNAINVLQEHWESVYEEYDTIKDKHLEIINTRIINIKSKINSEEVSGEEDLFNQIDYVVEFELLSNYYDTSPFFFNAYVDNWVVVYKDGTSKVSRNLLNIYRATTYSSDFSPIIESIEEFNSRYDQVLEIE